MTTNPVFRSIESRWRGPLPCAWSELCAGVVVALVDEVAQRLQALLDEVRAGRMWASRLMQDRIEGAITALAEVRATDGPEVPSSG